MNRKNNKEKDAPCRKHKGPATKDDCDHCIWRVKVWIGGSPYVRCGY